MTNDYNIEKVIEDTNEIVCVCDDNLVYLNCNKNYALMFGTTPDKLIGRNILEVYPQFENSVFYETILETIKTGENLTRLGYSNNLNNWFVTRMHKVNKNYNVLLANKVEDVNKFHYVAKIDSLTSITNRFSLEEHLDKTYAKSKKFTLFLIDILKFKSINDSFGVTLGDMILMEFAARLKKFLGKEIKLYRYNADQFAVVIDTIDKEEINKTIKSIQESKIEHFIAKSNHITIDLGIGYCSVHKFEKSFQEIITHAEIALSKSKKSKKPIEFDETEFSLDNQNKVILANELKKALKENNGLVLYYQRQVNCFDRKICGAEALIRWEHPTKGFISPAQFLPVAEEFDLMFDLDKYVFIRAIKEIYELTRKGINIPIAVNLSSSSLCNPKIVELIKAILTRININPKLITIEITESAFIEEKLISRKIVEEIKALGLNVALDDFGTGYSSMEYLLSYPADYLKIDKEFIRKINEDSQRKKIVKGLITMAQSLDMSVIAEGVETKEEANALVAMNCNCIQGYFFGKPQKLSDLIQDIEKLGYSKNKGEIKTNNMTLEA